MDKSNLKEKTEKTVRSKKKEEVPKPAPPEPVTQFGTKLNKYGFLHVKKKVLRNLPFKVNEPIIVRIEGNKVILEVSR